MYIQIMIIDSDLSAAKQLKYHLQNETVRAYYTTSVEEGITHLAHFCYQIVIMDISSWDVDGLKQLKRIQALVSVPILALSTNNTSDHIVEILTIADDFLQKPFGLSVCAAKIQVLLHRSRKLELPYNAQPILSSDNRLLIGPGWRKVILPDTEIILLRKQFEFLYLLAGNPGHVFIRELLYEKVWGETYIGNDKSPELSNEKPAQQLKNCTQCLGLYPYQARCRLLFCHETGITEEWII